MFRHFPAKEELVAAVFTDRMDACADAAATALAAGLLREDFDSSDIVLLHMATAGAATMAVALRSVLRPVAGVSVLRPRGRVEVRGRIRWRDDREPSPLSQVLM
ncbi:hypothetical protein [Streptomyces soliscabiei]|uniref:hypothetical protein n=1 Tax=Streptomyces soliscabiei TaxID=588897 RepID=UPI0029BB5A5D|nr:hypothetical protein [Streptomyces sp. NY05-11A]MDX2678182.1 hypothetical protein [Streptomyces sp. NY05-11A]